MDPFIQYPEEFRKSDAGQPLVQHLQVPQETARVDAHPASAMPPSSPQPHREERTRAQAREALRRERDEGVEYYLVKTRRTARVRDLPFTDRVMLTGIPVEMKPAIDSAINQSLGIADGSGPLSVDAMLRVSDGDQALADALCIAGFIKPRLVRIEAELDGTDDVWLVDDIHPDDRKAYRVWISRDRGEDADIQRLAAFHGAGVAEAGIR